jgi:NDP-sugar pyrophosphorylase family protein
MVPLRNRPYVHYMVDAMRAAGLDGAIFSMGYLPEPIQGYFADRDLGGFTLDYVVEDQSLGTAGGIKNAEAYLDEGPFVATNGDVLSGVDLAEVIEAHRESGVPSDNHPHLGGRPHGLRACGGGSSIEGQEVRGEAR